MTEATYTTSATRVASDNPQLSGAKIPTSAERLAAFKAQFRYFYGQASGYFAIDAGAADDEASTGIQLLVERRSWHYYDPQRPDLLETAADVALEYAETFGNVYLTRTLHEHKRATKESAKPSRIIAVEDAPEVLPVAASRVLRTSPGSRQAFYRLVEPVSTKQAEKLSKLIARVLGADRSGTNANKVLRLVGGLNTKKKYGAPHLVHVESRERDYTYDELWQAYSAYLPEDEAAARETEERDRAAVRWPEAKEQWVEHWRTHIDVLMIDRVPRVFKLHPTSQGYKIFGDDEYIAGWKHESGSWDASTVRWVRAHNLVRSGCTDEMTAAICEAAEHAETFRIKGRNAVRNDIRQAITEAREKYGYERVGAFARKHQPEYTTPAEGQTDQPNAGGRPAKLTADALLTFYREQAACGVVLMTRAEVAEELHVSSETIYRLNSELKTRGEITVEHSANRQRSFVRLARLVKTSDAKPEETTRNDETTERAETPQTTNEAPQAVLVTHSCVRPALGEETACGPGAGDEPAAEASGNVRSSQSPPAAAGPPLSRRQVLDSLIVEALEQCAADERINTASGEIVAGRASWPVVLSYVSASPLRFAEPSIRRRYEYWLKKRRWLRQIAKLRQDAPHYKSRRLHSLARWCERILMAGDEAPQYPVAAQYYAIVEAELERRLALRGVVLSATVDPAERERSRPKKPYTPMPQEELPLFLGPIGVTKTA